MLGKLATRVSTTAWLVAWPLTASAVPAEYAITDLPPLPASPSCRALALNDGGDVVGWCKNSTSGIEPRRGVIWFDGEPNELATLPDFPDYYPAAINNAGQVVGYAVDNNTIRGVLWLADSITDLNDHLPLGSGWELKYAMDINDAGQIVGRGLFNGDARAFRLDNGVITNLGTLGGASSRGWGINELGVIVGDAEQIDGERHAFLWQDGVMTVLGAFDGNYSIARDINDAKRIVGSFGTQINPGGSRFPFTWQDGIVTKLDFGDTFSAGANAVNGSGQVVGSGTRSVGFLFLVAMLWENGERYELYDLVPLNDGWLVGLGSPQDINDAGQIAGFSFLSPSDGNEHAYLLTPIVCGDGIVVPGETCDDGNTDPGDGCDENCQVEIPIPAVSEWGLTVLALLVLTAGTVALAHRRRASRPV